MNCPKCDARALKNGTTKDSKQKYRCTGCGYNFEEPLSPAVITGAGISEKDLRAKHDLRFIVKHKCEELKSGVFLTQAEFVQFCKINPGAGYRGVIEHPEYEKFHGKAGGTVYWSHPDSIEKLKNEGVLL